MTAEVGDPVVVREANAGEQLGVLEVVPEQALAGLQNSTPHAVELELLDHRVRAVGAVANVLPDLHEVELGTVLESSTGLRDRSQGDDLSSPMNQASASRPSSVLYRRISGARCAIDFGMPACTCRAARRCESRRREPMVST